MSLRDRLAKLFTSRRANAPAPSDEGATDEADDAFDPFNPFPEPISFELTDVLDLHTIAPRDVRRAVEAYLAEAHRLGFRSVRLIHGKGRGVQRATVRAILARTPFVLDWTDAPSQA